METDVSPRSLARSCTTCAKAKAKCVKRMGDVTCERCTRLRKECQFREPIVKRRKPTKTTRAAQIESLENKIEHLVNALATAPQVIRASHEYGQPSPPVSLVSTSRISTDRSVVRTTDEMLHSLCDQEQRCETTSPPALNPESTKNNAVSLTEAEVLVDRYARLMADGLPFVVLAPSVSAQELNGSNPVLLKAITTVSLFHDLSRQQVLVKDLIRDLSERIMINNEKSLDILQAIVVLVGFYHPHIMWSHQVTNLLHLGIAISVDLGIDRTPQHWRVFKSQTTKAVHGPNLATRMPTLAEHRALLGLFYLTSMLATSFRKIDAMPFTRHMGECLESLEHAKEYDSDMFLRSMVKIQRAAQISHDADCINAPAKLYSRAFHADLENLRSLDPCPEDNVFLKMQYLTADILAWELSLVQIQEDKSKPLSSVLDELCRCVGSIRQFLDAYFTIPPSAYLLLPFSVFGQFAHAAICLTKLASLQVDGWDLDALKDQLNFMEVIEDAAQRFEAGVQTTIDGQEVKNEIFGKWAPRVRWMKQVYQTRFSQDGRDQGSAQPHKQLKPPEDLGHPTPPTDGIPFSFLDETFWDSFGDFELGWPEPVL